MQLLFGLSQSLRRLKHCNIISFYYPKKDFTIMNGNAEISSFSGAKDSLMKYTGGSVKLTKYETSGIATICFSNSQKKNAWTGTMMVQLSDAVSDLEKWHTGKGVLLYSEGDDFCSGADLSLIGDSMSSEVGKHMSRIMHNAITRLTQIPLITAVLVQGKAIGGGTELLTACDFCLITSNFRCNFVHLKMGLITGWGGITRLVKLLGPTKALELASSCACLSANEALSIGLATTVISDEGDRLENALLWLREHTVGDAPVLRTMKQAVINAANLPLKDAIQKEHELFLSVLGGPAFKAAVQKNLKHRY